MSATPGTHGTPPNPSPSPSSDRTYQPPSGNPQPTAHQGPTSPSSDHATPSPSSDSGPTAPPGTTSSPSSLSNLTPSSAHADHSPSSDTGPAASPGTSFPPSRVPISPPPRGHAPPGPITQSSLRNLQPEALQGLTSPSSDEATPPPSSDSGPTAPPGLNSSPSSLSNLVPASAHAVHSPSSDPNPAASPGAPPDPSAPLSRPPKPLPSSNLSTPSPSSDHSPQAPPRHPLPPSDQTPPGPDDVLLTEVWRGQPFTLRSSAACGYDITLPIATALGGFTAAPKLSTPNITWFSHPPISQSNSRSDKRSAKFLDCALRSLTGGDITIIDCPPGLPFASNAKALRNLHRSASALGYSCTSRSIDAHTFGAPWHRTRLLIFLSNDALIRDLGPTPFPAPNSTPRAHIPSPPTFTSSELLLHPASMRPTSHLRHPPTPRPAGRFLGPGGRNNIIHSLTHPPHPPPGGSRPIPARLVSPPIQSPISEPLPSSHPAPLRLAHRVSPRHLQP